MDGMTMNVGAVGNVRKTKSVAKVARGVFDYTSTNGLRHKIPGRVGDVPVPGAGAYATKYAAAAATGNGDLFMRLLPSFQAVNEMKNGETPLNAARKALQEIKDSFPTANGALIAINAAGDV